MGRKPKECNMKVVLMNDPPDFKSIPEPIMRRFCRALTDATLKWLEEEEQKKMQRADNAMSAAEREVLEGWENKSVKQLKGIS